MDKPEKIILEKFQQGDERAFGVVYNHYREPVIRFCVSIIKDEQEAENLYHDVFIKIWKKRASINPELNFTYYVFAAIKNQIFDYLKEVKRNEVLKEKFWEKIVESQRENKEEKEDQYQHLESLITSLSPKRKEIIELNFAEGKSYEEIADKLLISKNTVKNQLVKAKQILRKGIEAYITLKT
jgi:RNA polymerase sigma-70 factor (family 1)